jgi:hypothetical protein
MILYPGGVQTVSPNPHLSILRTRGESPLVNSLISFWKCDEASGDRADSIGTNTLVDINTVGTQTGKVYALAASPVTASSERLSVADNATLEPATDSFWVGAWVYIPTAGVTQIPLGKWDDAARCIQLVQLATNNFRWDFSNAANGTPSVIVTATSVTITAANWYFVVGWKDSVGNLSGIQVNNSTRHTGSFSSGAFNNTEPFTVGGRGDEPFFTGGIGPVMIGRNYVPTAADVTFLYNSGNGITLDAMRNY